LILGNGRTAAGCCHLTTVRSLPSTLLAFGLPTQVLKYRWGR
jgi:hypothetical protein